MSMRYHGPAVLLGVLTLVTSGCYRYTQVETARLGMEVRAQLEAEAAARRSQGLDEPITSYDGTVVDVTDDTLMLDVLVARSASAFQDVEVRDTVRLGTSEVRRIMQRRIAPLQTALVTIAAGVGAFALVKGIDAVVGGTDEDDDGREPTFRVMVFSLTGSRLVPAFLGTGREE